MKSIYESQLKQLTGNDDYVLEVLKEEGIITEENCSKVIEILQGCHDWKELESLKSTIIINQFISDGIITVNEMMACLASRFGLEMINLDEITVFTSNQRQLISIDIAEKYGIFPVKKENDILTVAIGDPLNVDLLDSLRYVLNCDIEAVVANQKSIRDAINRLYGVEEKMGGEAKKEAKSLILDDITQIGLPYPIETIKENISKLLDKKYPKALYINELPHDMKVLWYAMSQLCKYREFTRCQFKAEDKTRSCHYSNCPCVETIVKEK